MKLTYNVNFINMNKLNQRLREIKHWYSVNKSKHVANLIYIVLNFILINFNVFKTPHTIPVKGLSYGQMNKH